MTPERYAKICSVLNRRQPDLTVITEEIHKGRNLSAIIRTCDAVGIDQLHCVTPAAGYRAYRGTALGSHKWVETVVHETVESPIVTLKSQGFQIVAAHPCETVADFRAVDYTQPTALLLGSEKQGLSETARASVDRHVRVPMVGMVESFNVSVACAIILAECQWQRQQAGLYDRPRLPADSYRRRLFQWAHPMLAAFCDARGLAYPALGGDGEVLQPVEWHRYIREMGYG